MNPFLEAVAYLRDVGCHGRADDLQQAMTDPSSALVERVADIAQSSMGATRSVLRALSCGLDRPEFEEVALLREARDELTTWVIVNTADDQYRCTLCDAKGPAGEGLPHEPECLIARLYEAVP